jgi:hypothetical protein
MTMIEPGTDSPDPTASEFTVFFPMKPGAQDALREVLRQAEPIIAELLVRLQTVHDMRWVFIPGDRYLMLATVFDGSWDRYIDDFSTEATPLFDALGAHIEGYPGTQSGDQLKDFIRSTQVDAELFAFAYPGRSVPEILRALRVHDAFQELLDASQS